MDDVLNWKSISAEDGLIHSQHSYHSLNTSSTNAIHNQVEFSSQSVAKLSSSSMQPLPPQVYPFIQDPLEKGYQYSRPKGGLEASSHQRPVNNITTFDFNHISRHRPAYHMLSKLSALPQINAEPRQTPAGYHYSQYRWDNTLSGINGEMNHGQSQVSDFARSHILTDNDLGHFSGGEDILPPNRTCGFHSVAKSGPIYSVQNITLNSDRNPMAEHSGRYESNYESSVDKEQPQIQSSRREVQKDGHLLSIFDIKPDFSHSDLSDYEAYAHHKMPAKRRRGKESTTLAGTPVGPQTGGESTSQCPPDLRNAVLINNWIKILESTKDIESYSEQVKGSEGGHFVYPPNFKQVLLKRVQEKVANVDLGRFFHQPEAIMREYNRLKHPSSLESDNGTQFDGGAYSFVADSSSQKSTPSPYNMSYDGFTGGHQSEYPGGIIKYGMAGSKPLPSDQQRMMMPRAPARHVFWPPNPKYNGLVGLLDIHSIDTKGAFGKEAESVQEAKQSSAEAVGPGTPSSAVLPAKQSTQLLDINLDRCPKQIRDSIHVNPIANPRTRANYPTTSFTKHAGGYAPMESSEQYLQNIYANISAMSGQVKGKGHVKKRGGKTQKLRQRFPPVMRQETVNLHPNLVIVGSSALDMEELRWREEMKALIQSMVKSKSLTRHQLNKLKSLYSILHSDSNEHHMSAGDNPEDFLKKLLAPKVVVRDGLFYMEDSLVGNEGLSNDEVWELAYDDEWLAKQDITALLSKADTIKDPQILKRLIVEKIRRETGISGKDKDDLMQYIEENVYIMVDPESGQRVPVLPPSLAKILARKESDAHQQDSDVESSAAGLKASLLAVLSGDGELDKNDEGLYYDFASGTVRKMDELTRNGIVKLLLDPLEVNNDGSLPKRLPAYVSRNLSESAYSGKRRRRKGKGKSGSRRRRRDSDGEGSANDSEDRYRRRRRRRREMEGSSGSGRGRDDYDDEEYREERKRRREERRKRRREEGLASEDDAEREERRRRRKEKRKRRRAEGLDGEDETEREERRKRRRERRQREGLDSGDSETREERRQRRRERKKRRRERGLENEDDSESDEAYRRRKERRRKRRMEEGVDTDEDSESREERRQRRRERRKRRREEEGDDDSDTREKRRRRRKERRRRRREEDSESESSDEPDGEKRERRGKRQRKKERKRAQKSGEIGNDSLSSSSYDSYDSDTDYDSSYDSLYSSSDYTTSSSSGYTSYSDHSIKYHTRKAGARKTEKGRGKSKKQLTQSKLKDFRRIFKRSDLKLGDDESSRSKRRGLGVVKAGDDPSHARGKERRKGSGKEVDAYDPLLKGTMLKEIGEVMDIVKTIQESVTISRPGTVQHDPSGKTLPSSKPSSRGKLSSKDMLLRNTSRHSSSQPQVDGQEDTSPQESEEVREAREREARRRELEDEMAGDLERQWEEVARQRKLKAEAKVNVEALQREHNRLMKQEEREILQRRAKEKEHHAAMLEKFRAEGIYRQYLHRNEQEIVRDYERTNAVWSEVDYTTIAFYLGDEYAADVRKAEKQKEQQLRAEYERQLQKALDFQRDELLVSLRNTQKDMLLGGSVQTVDVCHLLEISRAFVYSYFDNVVDIICQ